MEKLTKRQNDVLTFVKTYIVTHGYPPTVREIGKALNISSPATIHAHLTNLENKGFIKKDGCKNRAIELLVTNEFDKTNDLIAEIPLLGTVTAGNPIEAIEIPEQYFTIPANLLKKGKEIFALETSGTSMINAGILDGDIIIIEKCDTAKNGDIVVAMTDENEVTLKTFYKEENHFRLQPENDSMEPIILTSVNIIGKAIGLYRKM